MGIQGLLKRLSCFSEKRRIDEFANQSLAIDASSWLHKSVYSVAESFVESTERSKNALDSRCVNVSKNYIARRCRELLLGGRVKKIYLVMDGKRCPLKQDTTFDREQRRTEHLTEARKFKREGRHDKAENNYKMCIRIHKLFADRVAQLLETDFRSQRQQHQVEIIQSPFEADAQLVKLCIDGYANAIVTEDSDVLVYSAVCCSFAPILFKLDRHSGLCDVLSMQWLLDSSSPIPQSTTTSSQTKTQIDQTMIAFRNREKRQPGLGVRLFVQACALAGSDYSPSRLDGVGIVSAFRMVKDHAYRTCNDRFSNILKCVKAKQRGSEDMKQYERILAKTEAAFYHHPILDLATRQVSPLVPLKGEEINTCDFRPCLKRFQFDLSFLGLTKGQGNDELIPQEELEEMEHQQHTKTQINRDSDSDIAKLMNPYSKKTNTSSSIEDNPFKTFGLSSDNKTPSNQATGGQQVPCFSGDVRFVQPKSTRRYVSEPKKYRQSVMSRFLSSSRDRKSMTNLIKKSLHSTADGSFERRQRTPTGSHKTTGKLDLLQHTLASFGSCKARKRLALENHHSMAKRKRGGDSSI